MTGRVVPSGLVTSFGEAATTRARLFKVVPEAEDASNLYLTNLDRDIPYDNGDGDGLQVYLARRGYSAYSIETASDISVNNSQQEVLLSEYELDGITLDQIKRGVYDDARFLEMAVDYMDTSLGHVVLNSGFIGQVKTVDGMMCFPEMRSLSQTLKQKSIIENGSNNCRAKFGDERCKFDVDSLWVDAQITAVGIESDRVVTVDGPALADNQLKPGLLEVLDGVNAGRTYEIESNDNNVITLSIPAEKPFVIGVSVRYRPDCTKLWDGPNSCLTYDNRLNFRGEPHRPVADTASLMVPKPSRTG